MKDKECQLRKELELYRKAICRKIVFGRLNRRALSSLKVRKGKTMLTLSEDYVQRYA